MKKKSLLTIVLAMSLALCSCGTEPESGSKASETEPEITETTTEESGDGISVEENSSFTNIVIPLSYFGEMNNEEIKNDVFAKIPDAVGISIEGGKAKVGLKPSDYEKIKDNLDELFPS